MSSNVINDSLTSNEDPWGKLDDATAESILACLPVADYVHCRLVSRRWGSIIRSPTFSKVSKELFNRLPWVFMLNNQLPSNVVYDMEVDEWRHIELLIPKAMKTPSTPLAASSSLMCCVSAEGVLFVCNPLTGYARGIAVLINGGQYKAITMHAVSPKSYNVDVVEWTYGILVIHRFSPGIGEMWTPIPLTLYKMVQNPAHGYHLTEVPRFTGVQLVVPVRGAVLEWMPTKAVATIDTSGELVVYYCESNGQLVGCFSEQEIAILFLPIPVSNFSYDLVECHGRILVLTLATEDETEMLRVWEFDFEEEEWKNVATMPSEISEDYNGVDPLIDCAACGDFITICVSSMHYNFNKVAVFNVVENTWKELPVCVDPHCGQPKRFSSVLSFMPSIEAMP